MRLTKAIAAALVVGPLTVVMAMVAEQFDSAVARRLVYGTLWPTFSAWIDY